MRGEEGEEGLGKEVGDLEGESRKQKGIGQRGKGGEQKEPLLHTMSLCTGGLQRSLPKRSHSLANNSFLLDGNFRLDIPPPGGLGTASVEVIGEGGGGSQLPPGMGGVPGIPSGYNGPLEQESYPSSGEDDDDEEDDEEDDEDDDGEEGDYEDEESGKGSLQVLLLMMA